MGSVDPFRVRSRPTIDLKEHYREGLAPQLSALELAERTLAEGRSGAVESIRRLAHRLAGSAAGYGFPEISELACRVGAVEGPGIEEPLQRLVAALRGAAAEREAAPLKMLLVESDPIDTEILLKWLPVAPSRTLIARTTAEAERLLEEEEVGLVLLDLVLPDRDGRTLLVRMREDPRTATIPVFVISARWNDHTRAECLALDAEQFLQKPVEPEVLGAAVTASLRRYGRAARNSRHDPLTGLPNRAAFREAYARAVADASAAGSALSLAMVDLDRFENVNRDHGRATGDRVLRWSGETIASGIRRSDFLARWGGEGFVVLFPGTVGEQAVSVLEKVLRAMVARTCTIPQGGGVHVSFSAGICEVADDASLGEAIAVADRYLYLAKAAGRATVFCESSDVPRPSQRILVAGSDEMVSHIVMRRLGQVGFEVIHCADGDEALESVAQREVHLGILDAGMSGMDGYELLRRLRATPRFGDRPVVLLTGRGAEAEIVRGIDSGADDYIVKPFSPAELQARVYRLLRFRRPEAHVPDSG